MKYHLLIICSVTSVIVTTLDSILLAIWAIHLVQSDNNGTIMMSHNFSTDIKLTPKVSFSIIRAPCLKTLRSFFSLSYLSIPHYVSICITIILYLLEKRTNELVLPRQILTPLSEQIIDAKFKIWHNALIKKRFQLYRDKF